MIRRHTRITNIPLAEHLTGMTADEIVKLTGIEKRRWVDTHESALTLGVNAAQNVLNKAGLSSNDLDLVLCCSGTPEFMTPSMACLMLLAAC